MSVYRHDKKYFKYLKRFIESKRASKENQINCNEDYRSSHPEVFLKKVFRRYAANLQENTHTKVWFQ